MQATKIAMDPTSFETHPSRYHHWKLAIDGEKTLQGVAELAYQKSFQV